MGHCAPLVPDPELLSTGGCIHVADKALISSSACPSIPILHPPAVQPLSVGPQLILPTLEHLAGLRTQAQGLDAARPYSLMAWPTHKPRSPGAQNKDARFLPTVEGGPERRSKTRAPGSQTQEWRQSRALRCWLQRSPGRMLQPPLPLPPPNPTVNGRTHTAHRPWLSHAGAALGSGRRKQICSMFPVFPLSPDFFLLWEQGTACVTDNKGK